MTQPCYGDRLYISGFNPGIKEIVADGCLSLHADLWNGKTIEIIQEEHNFEMRYGERGYIYPLFSNNINLLNTCGIHSCCVFPTFAALALGTLVTCAATKPFELIGKCLKSCVLETNSTARIYNEMAANHLQMLKDHDVYPDRIERLKSKLESEKTLLSLYENLNPLVLAKTKYRLAVSKKATLVTPLIAIDLTITPILDKDRVVDYEISDVFNSTLGLPTNQNTLCRDIQFHKNNIQKLEKEIDEKSKLFQSESEKFEQNVRELIND